MSGPAGLAKPAAIVAAPLLAALAALGAVAATATISLTSAVFSPSPASPTATAHIPPAMPWQIVAAIGTVESGNGTSTLPGVHSGANSAGAEGPMQFEPATFAQYDSPNPPGGINPPDIYDPVDSVYAAVRMLCADGAASGNLPQAIEAYNHSAAYEAQVWNLAVSYGMATDGSTNPGLPPAGLAGAAPGNTWPGDPATVIAYALTQLGVPYQWGGETPGVALDCSGLVQLSYRAAGISLPRTSEAQATYGTPVPLTALQPADLLFFNDGTPFGHVAIYLGDGLMIQAPYTGTVVSIAPIPPADSVEAARQVIVNP